MIHVSDIQDLERLTIHKVGNASAGDVLVLSKSPIELQDETIGNLLLSYFIQPFAQTAEYFQFKHDARLELNEVYSYCKAIFDDPNQFQEQSVHIAKHLFKVSTHPKIKSGELYVAYFSACQVDGETVEAIGIFKSENRDTYLKVMLQQDSYAVEYEDGININKLDKGCLIFNIEREAGYKVSIVDSISKQQEAVYWKDAFLQVQRKEDSYHQTETVVHLCQSFIQQKLPETFELSRVDQIELLQKSQKYFKENEEFKMDEFASSVLGHPEAIESFQEYRDHFQGHHQLDIPESFEISAPAFKKQQRVFKSVLKLDRNFSLYIHGNREMIERGYDEERNMNYYKLYYEEEK
jgi:hypothetical protein